MYYLEDPELLVCDFLKSVTVLIMSEFGIITSRIIISDYYISDYYVSDYYVSDYYISDYISVH